MFLYYNYTTIPTIFQLYYAFYRKYFTNFIKEGENFDYFLKREARFTQAQVVRWGRQLLEAPSYLYSPIHGDPPHGYTHSDIKPANLMLTPLRNVCLINFNISLALWAKKPLSGAAKAMRCRSIFQCIFK